MEEINRNFFAQWYQGHGRDFPWRSKTLDPFHQLITEMLLRKTRAEAVAKLWPNLVSSYPDARSIVRASKKRLARQLRVLGFGTQKADALQSASKWLIEHHGGKVPGSFEDLMRIPHIGAYSAGAVLCFGFSRRFEIVDVNVQRLFSRYYGLDVYPDVRRNPVIKDIARRCLPRTALRAEQHNYGLLDFAALICKSTKPRCLNCPLAPSCSWARANQRKIGRNSDKDTTIRRQRDRQNLSALSARF